MKIKTISCTQFAGIRNREISFEDGINLIYGKNESGKSTLVNLLSRTLFQNAHIDGRKDKDKEFKELYYPSDHKDGRTGGDFADGKITFETENGTYTLTKEWSKDGQCQLSAPDRTIRDPKEINDSLKNILLYGEGVYSEMLFSSQRNTDLSLQKILDASKKGVSKEPDVKKEITNAISKAFSESDGITADAIEQQININIKNIKGKHWDENKGVPVVHNGRWKRDTGEILDAYYELEDAEKKQNKITELEDKADREVKDFKKKDDAAKNAEEEYTRFTENKGKLELKNSRCDEKERLEEEVPKLENILSEWPKLEAMLEKAKILKKEKENRELLDKYKSAKELTDAINVLRSEIEDRACPTDHDISNADNAQKEIRNLENKLCGMNLSAVVRMFGENTVSITTLRNGQELDITDASLSITEAVKITVPGVMEMQLSPADVDVSKVKKEITEQEKIISDIFDRYDVENLDKLKDLKNEITDNNREQERLSDNLSNVLGKTEYEKLKSDVNSISGEVRNTESIEADILEVCGSDDVTLFIMSKENKIGQYKEDHGNPDLLQEKIENRREKLEKIRRLIEEMKDIPPEYAYIPDPEEHLTKLEQYKKEKQNERKDAFKAKTEAARDLENYEKELSYDPIEDVENKRRIFDEKKALLRHWMHIQEVFVQQKQSVQNNPMQDISDSFTRYLGMISDGTITSEFPEPEKLNMNIYSGSSKMDYGKLSEGTKETVSLAFRLAVLDHLFPDGGGVIVFDDPFTDMDSDRTKQSCKLIRESAKRHQVIFLTCKDDYAEMLGGNKIRIES